LVGYPEGKSALGRYERKMGRKY